MERGMRIFLPQLDLEVKARLLDHLAPQTCRWVWNILAHPLENEVLHVTFLGRGITCRYSLPHPGRPLPRENLTVTPAAGDILIVDFNEQTGRSRGFVAGEGGMEMRPKAGPGTYVGFDLFYGPDSRMFIPMGWHASCHFAEIVGNLEGLARVGGLTRLEGAKRVVFSRLRL